MALIEEFFIELDRRWAAERANRLRLRVIGSAALRVAETEIDLPDWA